MAWPFRGNINGTVDSQAQNAPMVVENYFIVNKAAGASVFNVYLIKDASSINISPLNKSLSAGEVYHSDRPVVMLATSKIRVQSSDSVDYDFFINNMTSD